MWPWDRHHQTAPPRMHEAVARPLLLGLLSFSWFHPRARHELLGFLLCCPAFLLLSLLSPGESREGSRKSQDPPPGMEDLRPREFM